MPILGLKALLYNYCILVMGDYANIPDFVNTSYVAFWANNG
ncbi:hypothetical protein [Calothrix sp. PCC 7507]|nr:hypothetical protein [Calothrix sp. PCC 7507]AFY32141.1 hypothetical protein Cal7507_1684 [Calothrix sp. PCC 7507]